MRISGALTVLVAALGMCGSAGAQGEPGKPALDGAWLDNMDWRLIGPANMSGRIIDVEVYEANPKIYYVGSAGGGLIKTVNNGVTFDMLFQHESSMSIGDVAVAADDPDLVWIGTGEHNPRNSVSWGDGVYKSTDGGKTWKNMGLTKTFQIGMVLVHPKNHDTVFVGALGRLWGPNEDRGLYRTTDGGATWEKVLYIDDKTGIIDMAFHPTNPDIMLAAAWERQRDEFDTNDPATRWGPGSGLYRTEDGGTTWTKITAGLPTADMGRMGMDFSGVNPDTVFMLVDSVRIGEGIPNPGFLGMNGESADVGARLTNIVKDGPAEKAGLKEGDIVLRFGDEPVLSYDDLLAAVAVRPAGTAAVAQVVRAGELVDVDVTLGEHPQPNQKPFERDLGGQRESIQDQQGPDGHETGGLFKSVDAGKTWTRINSVNPRPIYFSKFYVDPSDDNRMWILGVPLSKSSDGGKTWTRDGTPDIVHVDHHSMWIDPKDGEHLILGNDGGLYVSYDRGASFEHLNKFVISQLYHVAVDNQALYMVYGGLQDNGSWGGPNRTRGSDGPYNEDWFRIGGGDGFICQVDPQDPAQLYSESQNGGIGSINLRTGARTFVRPRPERGTEYRWNWKTPFMLSHHNGQILYAAGNFVFRSFAKGTDIKRLSPEITRTRRGSATAFDESPVDPDLLMVGSDDGALWVSRDGGGDWENIMYPFDASVYTEEPVDTSADVGEAGQPQSGRPTGGGPGGPGGGRGGAGAGGAPPFDSFLTRFDADEDGLLQVGELPERMQPYAKMLDADENGAINEDEMTKIREFMAALPAEERGAGFGGGRGGAGRGGRGGQPDTPAIPEPPAAPAVPAAPAAPAAEPPAEAAPAGPAHPLNGEWTCQMGGQQVAGAPPFTMIITKLDDSAFRVEVMATVLNDKTDSAVYDGDKHELSFSVTGPQGKIDFKARLDGDSLVGTLGSADMGFEAPFTGKRELKDTGAKPTGPTLVDMIPGPRRVQSIEWSKFERERVYVVLDGHYSNDDEPYVFVSEDAGKTWKSLRANLPVETTRVLREDNENRDVLYLGTEFGMWISVDRGASWTKFAGEFPNVSVHEIAQHESNGELIVGTHGRGAWAVDVTPLRQMNAAARSADAYLYAPNTFTQWRYTPERGRGANGVFAGDNPSREGSIFYSLGSNTDDLTLEVRDAAGKLVRTLELPANGTRAGLHRVDWDMRRDPPAGSQRQRFRRGQLIDAGTYRVVLTAGDAVLARTLEVVNDPAEPGTSFDYDTFVEGFEVEEEEEGEED